MTDDATTFSRLLLYVVVTAGQACQYVVLLRCQGCQICILHTRCMVKAFTWTLTFAVMLDVCQSSFAGQVQMLVGRFAAPHWLPLARHVIVSRDVLDFAFPASSSTIHRADDDDRTISVTRRSDYARISGPTGWFAWRSLDTPTKRTYSVSIHRATTLQHFPPQPVSGSHQHMYHDRTMILWSKLRRSGSAESSNNSKARPVPSQQNKPRALSPCVAIA